MKNRLHNTFAAMFVSRNYRLYFYGQTVSLAGTWMQTIAQGWLVLQLSDSGTAVGLVTAAQFVPVLLFGQIGGVVADRFDNRKILFLTQILFAVQALALGILTATGMAQLWMVYGLAMLFGLITVVDNPARQTFILELVGPKHLTNAVTLNSVNMNAARIVGPAIAATLIAVFGIAPSFFVNAASYGALMVALVLMDRSQLRPVIRAPRQKGQLVEGFRYVWHTRDLRVQLGMMALIGMLAYEFQVVLPVMAKFTFGGTAGTYGLMTAAMGVGAVVGGLATAGRSRHGLDVLVMQATLLGITMVAVAVSPNLPIAVAALVALGATSITFLARGNATMQLTADPAFRGRVMALWTVAFLGSTPIGGPIIGWIGESFGARWGMATGALACFVGAGYGWLRGRERVTTDDEQPAAAAAHTAAA